MKQKIVLASNNEGKLKEIQEILSNLEIELIPQKEFNFPEAEETGLSFIENAVLKARHASHYSKLPAIADDSGLTVDALNGAPGVYSSRYAGEKGNDQKNNQKLLEELSNVADEERTASFICAIAYVKDEFDPLPKFFVGQWYGKILHEPRGEKGFGYDPLFYVTEHQCTAAEMLPKLKNSISHRAKALELLQKENWEKKGSKILSLHS